MSIAVEHERFILTATNNSERILLPTASGCKRDVYQVLNGNRTAWVRHAAQQLPSLIPTGDDC